MIHLLLVIIYLSFISLGLPDSLLGSAWPAIYPELSIPVSYAGIISMIIAIGILIMLLPFGTTASLIAFILIGFGCAPIYPCIIHYSPTHFGADKSHALIGVQMASAYMGTCLMPPLFGLIAAHIHIALLPFYLLILLITMAVMQKQLLQKQKIY